MSAELKIVIAGPCSSGKTEMANIIAEHTKGFMGNTEPTVGLRVLDFPKTIEINQMKQEIVIQLWDMSGYDKKQSASLEKYATKIGKDLGTKQILVVAHKLGASGENEEKVSRPKLPKGLESVRIVAADVKENFDAFIGTFETFSAQLYQIKLKKIEEKEKQMLGEQEKKDAPEEGAQK